MRRWWSIALVCTVVIVAVAAGFLAGIPGTGGGGVERATAGATTDGAAADETAVDGSAVVGNATGETTSDGTAREIEVTYRYARVPDRPGEVRVRATVHVPAVDRLRERLRFFEVTPGGLTVTDADGFYATENRRAYTWDGSTETPSITYRVGVNASSGPGTYETVDTTRWTVLKHGQTDSSFDWLWASDVDAELAVRETFAVADGQRGYIGSYLAYLGPHSVVTNRTGRVTTRLVVPDDADLSPERRAAALESLDVAARSLGTGGHDAVTVFVLPDHVISGHTPEGGEPEFLVSDSAATAGPDNTWIHEYVHTIQTWETTERMDWLDEGSAEFYETSLPMRHGTVAYDVFRVTVTDYRFTDADLRRPDQWPDQSVEYDRGAHVVAVVDARIRNATDGEKDFGDVFARLQEQSDPVSVADFEAAVAAVAGQSMNESVGDLLAGTERGTIPDDPGLYVEGSRDAEGSRDIEGDDGTSTPTGGTGPTPTGRTGSTPTGRTGSTPTGGSGPTVLAPLLAVLALLAAIWRTR